MRRWLRIGVPSEVPGGLQCCGSWGEGCCQVRQVPLGCQQQGPPPSPSFLVLSPTGPGAIYLGCHWVNIFTERKALEEVVLEQVAKGPWRKGVWASYPESWEVSHQDFSNKIQALGLQWQAFELGSCPINNRKLLPVCFWAKMLFALWTVHKASHGYQTPRCLLPPAITVPKRGKSHPPAGF